MIARRRHRVAAAVCVAGLVSNIACYAYRPVNDVAPIPEERLRITLTTEGTTELTRFLGPRVGAVEGTLVRTRSDGALDIAVEGIRTVDGMQQSWAGAGGGVGVGVGDGAVTIPRAYVAHVERNVLDRPRSALAGVVLGGVLVAIAAVALRSTSSQGGTGPGGGSPPP